jgi:hypothetical protein
LEVRVEPGVTVVGAEEEEAEGVPPAAAYTLAI